MSVDLEALLGDPWDAANPYGFAAGVARDAADEFPYDFSKALHEVGFHTNYLPGGESLERIHVAVRNAARRDLNVMPATMFSISAVLTVFAIGSPGQRELVSQWVRAGRVIGFALSEEHAGSDVLANTCALSTVDGGGYRLDGTKWLVGRGMSADAFLVVANSGGRGPGAFTAVLLDRPDGVTREPVAMTGMRGMDFANLAFDGVRVPATAVVGKVGKGLEGALKAQQIVRLMSTAGSMSTVDTALRTTLRFAGERRLGKGTVIDNPHARRELANAAAETIAADVTALVACRIAHLTPNAFNLASAVVKRVGTELTAKAVARCGGILGARAVVRDGYGAIWDKASRDNAMVKVIDTSPVGNLRALAMQLPAYAKVDPRPADARVFRLGDDLPALDAAALDLSPRPRDPVVPTFLALAAEIAEAAANTDITEIAGELQQVVQRKELDAADRFCTLYAGAIAVLAWWFNRDRPDLYKPGWLEGVTGYVTGRDALPALECVEEMAAAGLLFTALPAPLAEGGTAR